MVARLFCVGAVKLSETHGVLHGARILETQRGVTQADCFPLTTVLANAGPGIIEHAFDTPFMSTKDQLLYSALHGAAMRYAAERCNLDEAIEELCQIADSRNDILAEAAGLTARASGMPAQPPMLVMS